MEEKSNKALVLLSGGLDSTVVLSICKKLGYEVHAISFNYGQRHAVELEYVSAFIVSMSALFTVITQSLCAFILCL